MSDLSIWWFFPFVWSKPPNPHVLALLKFQAEGPRRKTLVGYIIITASRHLPTATTKISQTWINNSIILFSMKLLIWIFLQKCQFHKISFKKICDPWFMKQKLGSFLNSFIECIFKNDKWKSCLLSICFICQNKLANNFFRKTYCCKLWFYKLICMHFSPRYNYKPNCKTFEKTRIYWFLRARKNSASGSFIF